jgi:hypothetical protein
MPIERTIETECRLYALEWYVCLLHAATYRQMGEAGPAMLEQTRKQVLEGLRQKTFPSLDAAMSDLLSAELESAVERLLSMTKELLAKD